MDTEKKKKCGKRLQDIRKEKNLTQEELGEMIDKNFKTIGAIERGERSLTLDNAKLIGERLNVNPYYLLCETDSKTNHKEFLEDEYFKEDIFFFNHLIYKGNTIKAKVTLIYDPEQTEHYVTIDKIKGFKLSEPECACIIDTATHEAIITDIVVNDYSMPFQVFVCIIDLMYKYIDFTIENIPNFIECFIADYSLKDKIQNVINTSTPYNDIDTPDLKNKKEKI